MSCAICEQRKEKRFCPAVHGKICPQCCGEQREVTLDCPSECPYLLQSRQQVRQHAGEFRDRQAGGGNPAWSFPEIEIPEVEITEQFLYEREQLILGLSYALAKSARGGRSIGDRSINDRSIDGHLLNDHSLGHHPPVDQDLITALASLAKSYQTFVNSKLIYEPATTNLAHQSIAREIETMVKQFREAEQQHIGEIPVHQRLRDADVLKALVFLLRMALDRTSGRPKSRAFVDFLLEQFPERQSAIASPGESGSRIVIP